MFGFDPFSMLFEQMFQGLAMQPELFAGMMAGTGMPPPEPGQMFGGAPLGAYAANTGFQQGAFPQVPQVDPNTVMAQGQTQVQPQQTQVQPQVQNQGVPVQMNPQAQPTQQQAAVQAQTQDPAAAVMGKPQDFRTPGSRATPAAIRYNNPGAQYPGPIARKHGSIGTETIGGGHKIAVFDDATKGASAQFDLLGSKGYVGKTLKDAVTKWSGGNNSSTYINQVSKATGLKPTDVITRDMIANPKVGIPLAKSMAQFESGKPYPLTEDGWNAAHSNVFGSQNKPATTQTEIANQAQPMSQNTQVAQAPMKAGLFDLFMPQNPIGGGKGLGELIQGLPQSDWQAPATTGAEQAEISGDMGGGEPPTPVQVAGATPQPKLGADPRANPATGDPAAEGAQPGQQAGGQGFGRMSAVPPAMNPMVAAAKALTPGSSDQRPIMSGGITGAGKAPELQKASKGVTSITSDIIMQLLGQRRQNPLIAPTLGSLLRG